MQQLKSSLGICDENGIRGWVIDTHNPNERLEVEIFIDGELIVKTLANIFRQDLLDNGIDDGYCAFHVAIPNKFFDGIEHSVAVKEVVTGVLVTGSPKTFTLKSLRGLVDFCDENGIGGWAIDMTKPHVPVELEIFIDDNLVFHITANLFRQDLFDAKLGKGNCAFNVSIPGKFWDGVEHMVTACEVETTTVLGGSPKTFKLFSTVRGAIDRCGTTGIVGWVVNESNLSQPVEIDIFIDDELIAHATANLFRQDLLDVKLGNGNCGFSVAIPNKFWDGIEHNVNIQEVVTKTGLQGSPKTFKLSPNQEAHTQVNQAEISAPKLGYIDGVQHGVINGWVFSGTEGSFETLNVFVDDNYVDQVIADQYRSDLKTQGYNSGECAFIWYIPEWIRNSGNHEIDIRHQTGQSLSNSPVKTYGTTSTNKQLLNIDNFITDSTNIFVNPNFEGVDNLEHYITKGSNTIAEGWYCLAASQDIGYVSYRHSLINLTSSDLIDSVLHINSKKPIKLLHLIGNVKHRNNYFFLSPFTLSFYINKLNQLSPIILVIKCVIENTKNKFDVLHKQTIAQNISISGKVSICIPVDIINTMIRYQKQKPSILFEFSGQLDIELRQFKLDPSAHEYELPTIVGEFEDSSIASQANFVTGFFNINTKLNKNKYIQRWRSLAEQKIPEIVVPVFNSLEYVQECLFSIVKNTECFYLLTIVNDGSVHECRQWLEQFAEHKPWVNLLNNNVNMGYTLSINRAIRESSAAAIVLLNSDTVVSPGWLLRLMTIANSDPKIGLVGPLSNAASWQSVPDIKDEKGKWAINKLPVNMNVDDYAEIVRLTSNDEYPDVPILNGFCLYIQRKVFDIIGLFDEITFPQGYGEENDFCFRAIDAGFKLKVATNTYVYHAKTKSFGNERRAQLVKAANILLKNRYGEERFKNLEIELSSLPTLKNMRQLLKNKLENTNNG